MNKVADLLVNQPASDEGPVAYRRIKSEIAKRAMTERVAAGECPGRAPVGYRNVPVGHRHTIEVDQRLAPLIIEAFRLAAQHKSSIRKVLAELTPRGLVGKEGKPMGVSGLQFVLANPFYAGLIRHAGALHRGAHQPLVSRSLFNRVQQRLFRRRCSGSSRSNAVRSARISKRAVR